MMSVIKIILATIFIFFFIVACSIEVPLEIERLDTYTNQYQYGSAAHVRLYHGSKINNENAVLLLDHGISKFPKSAYLYQYRATAKLILTDYQGAKQDLLRASRLRKKLSSEVFIDSIVNRSLLSTQKIAKKIETEVKNEIAEQNAQSDIAKSQAVKTNMTPKQKIENMSWFCINEKCNKSSAVVVLSPNLILKKGKSKYINAGSLKDKLGICYYRQKVYQSEYQGKKGWINTTDLGDFELSETNSTMGGRITSIDGSSINWPQEVDKKMKKLQWNCEWRKLEIINKTTK